MPRHRGMKEGSNILLKEFVNLMAIHVCDTYALNNTSKKVINHVLRVWVEYIATSSLSPC